MIAAEYQCGLTFIGLCTPTGRWTVTGYGQPIALGRNGRFSGLTTALGEACGFPTLPTAPADLEGGRLEGRTKSTSPLLGECSLARGAALVASPMPHACGGRPSQALLSTRPSQPHSSGPGALRNRAMDSDGLWTTHRRGRNGRFSGLTTALGEACGFPTLPTGTWYRMPHSIVVLRVASRWTGIAAVRRLACAAGVGRPHAAAQS
jgi:hypothetical protein